LTNEYSVRSFMFLNQSSATDIMSELVRGFA